MTASAAISVQGLSIAYRRALNPAGSLKEFAIRSAKRDITYERTWALRNVSLTVVRGEILGILGFNGAGKTTLMRAVAGVLPPTEGRVVVRGHVTPVLDLGVGLQPDLTGRENIVLLGALLGRDPRALRRRADEIGEWAGLSNYLEIPVRAYSAGMMARLAFAVVTDDEPDVLLLDEVLAVGDVDFTTRSLERIDRLAHQGAAVMIVSHATESIRTRATDVLWLNAGEVVMLGAPDEVIAAYGDAVAPAAIP